MDSTEARISMRSQTCRIHFYNTDFCCLTSTEARRPIRDGDEWEKGGDRRVKPRNRRQPGKTEAAVDRRQNNKMLRQCPYGIAQRAQHHAIAVPTAMQYRVTKTTSVAPPLGNN